MVHRNGKTNIFINDLSIRLKDITELLGNVGLGASSHHIISQGEADRLFERFAQRQKRDDRRSAGAENLPDKKRTPKNVAGKNGGKHKTSGKFEKRNPAPAQVSEKEAEKLRRRENSKPSKNHYSCKQRFARKRLSGKRIGQNIL